MNVIEIRLDQLEPYEKNAKKHDDTQVANVARSLELYGWQQPVVVDKNNVIVIGHCRVLAAKSLGWETAPCVVASELTDEEIKGLRIVDNKTNESAWDFDMLKLELPEIDLNEFVFDFDFSTVSADGASQKEIERTKEYDTEEFDDGKFKHECPACGFRFN